MSDGVRIFWRFVVVMLVLAGGSAVMIVLIKSRAKPQKKEMVELVTPITAVSAMAHNETVTVAAGGTVKPAMKIDLRPQVSGQVIEVAADLQPGGYFSAGDVLIKIDPRDYELAVVQRRAELARATFELENEKGRGSIAAREWELLGEDLKVTPEGRDLTLRKPHLKNAEAALEGAKSALSLAELNLERTVIHAPFNGMIQMENVDLGQMVNPSSQLAVLTGTDRYWVQASIPFDKIGFLQLPDRDGKGGAQATVTHSSGGMNLEKTGRVIRLLGDLDMNGRMARLLIAVDNPLHGDGEDSQKPLFLNAYVQVAIQGFALADVVAIPPIGLRDGNQVWIKTDDNKLEIRKVDVAWVEDNLVLIGNGLKADESVITSRIATPVPGMKLKLTGKDTSSADVAGGTR